MFYIGFTSAAHVDAAGRPYAEGELTVGAANLAFESELGAWSMRDYESQWQEAAAQLLTGGAASAFVTSFGGRDGARHELWPMWREGQTVYLQERMVVAEPFDPARAHELVGERVPLQPGGAVAEWALPLGQLATFLLDR